MPVLGLGTGYLKKVNTIHDLQMAAGHCLALGTIAGFANEANPARLNNTSLL